MCLPKPCYVCQALKDCSQVLDVVGEPAISAWVTCVKALKALVNDYSQVLSVLA